LNEPQKIIVPCYSNEESESKFIQLLSQQFPHIPIISLPRKHFNGEDGKQYIYNYCLQEDTAGLIVGITKKYSIIIKLFLL
jgi:DNA mismatch repair protein MSH4